MPGSPGTRPAWREVADVAVDPSMPQGRKIGPLVADDRATAEVVLSALLARVGDGEIFLDVPSITATRSRWR